MGVSSDGRSPIYCLFCRPLSIVWWVLLTAVTTGHAQTCSVGERKFVDTLNRVCAVCPGDQIVDSSGQGCKCPRYGAYAGKSFSGGGIFFGGDHDFECNVRG